MLYFILWTIVILTILLSIPIAHFVEANRRKKALAATQAETGAEEELEPGEEVVEEVEAEEEVVELSDANDDGFQDYEGEAVEGGDDFSAFDDAFDEEKS